MSALLMSISMFMLLLLFCFVVVVVVVVVVVDVDVDVADFAVSWLPCQFVFLYCFVCYLLPFVDVSVILAIFVTVTKLLFVCWLLLFVVLVIFCFVCCCCWMLSVLSLLSSWS